MLRPAMNDILKDGQSYYSFVLAVAKRARDIAIDAMDRGDLLDEKPVDLAVNEFNDGKYEFVETEESKG
ncbi:MAG: DNA-directed RNA polymerase subunit omega [Oscillospiraceae bacterium]|nr:DNA-directed RNA polymerase subunit omega [Oscillospiraceae bacterium]